MVVQSGLIPRIARQRAHVVTADTHPCPPTNWHPCFTCQQPAALQVIPRWEGHNDARATRLLRPIPRSLNVSYVGPPSKNSPRVAADRGVRAVMQHSPETLSNPIQTPSGMQSQHPVQPRIYGRGWGGRTFGDLFPDEHLHTLCVCPSAQPCRRPGFAASRAGRGRPGCMPG